MPKLRYILILLGFGLAVALYGILLAPREPSYKGKPLSQWIEAYSEQEVSEADEANEALHSMGTNAVPYLMAWFRAKPTLARKKGLARAAPLPPAQFKPAWIATDSPRRSQAMWALSVLGPAANSAIPELARLANDTNDRIRSHEAATVLFNLGSKSLAPLLPLLTNNEGTIRFNAAMEIGLRYAVEGAITDPTMITGEAATNVFRYIAPEYLTNAAPATNSPLR